jgi:arylsulfatase
MNNRDRPPIIILIVVDCLRADHLGCYGYKRDTSPNIDMFAGESVFFKWAFSVISYTCPSFASILTSLYPSRHSLGFQQKFPRLDQDRDLLVSEVLKSLHYSTAFFAGAIPLREGVGLNSGFDTYDCRIPDGRRSAEMTNHRFYEWLNSKYGTIIA